MTVIAGMKALHPVHVLIMLGHGVLIDKCLVTLKLRAFNPRPAEGFRNLRLKCVI